MFNKKNELFVKFLLKTRACNAIAKQSLRFKEIIRQERNYNVLINFLKDFIEFFSSETTFAFNDINIIIKLKYFVKHVDFKIFTDDFEKKTS